MLLPKYLEKEILEGRFFELQEKSVLQMNGFERYTFCLLKNENSRKEDALESIAEKIVGFAKKNNASATMSNRTYVLEAVEEKSPYGKRTVHEKVECIAIGITDPVAKELEDFMDEHVEETETLCSQYADPCVIHFENSQSGCGEKFMTGELYGYIRADHDKYSWHNSWFVNENIPQQIKDELWSVYVQACNKFPDGVRSMWEEWDTIERIHSDDEGNLYYKGSFADYWIRVIARQGDYNMYVKAYGRNK